MGMKANSGLFYGTSGSFKYSLDIQYFASGKMSLTGRILYSIAKNKKLKNSVKELYRPRAKVGDGGTAAAIRKQLKTGMLVGGKDHTIKGKERITNIENIIKKEKLNKSDLRIAIKLKTDLEKALGVKNETKRIK